MSLHCIFRNIVALTGLITALLPAAAGATEYLYLIDNAYSAPCPPGAAPWIEARFLDVAPGTVRLILSNEGLSGSEFLGSMLFNFNPSLDAACLNITRTGGNGDVAMPVIEQITDGFRSGAGNLFDLRFAFATENDGRFLGGRSQEFLITGQPGLEASDFICRSVSPGSPGPFYAAAHIQAIGAADYSVWLCPVPVPEPSATALLGLMAGLGFGLRRRRS